MIQFLVSAAHKSSGKTTVSLGLAAELARRGFIVQPFKKGPDYIDPIWLTQAAGRSAINLDFYTTGHDEIRHTFDHYRHSADVALAEGNKGLYDGMDTHGSDSSAALAKLLNLPVVLVIDCNGITRGVAPLVTGYQAFDREIRFAGVILNAVASDRHEAKLRSALEAYTDLKVFGAIRRDTRLQIAERHIGLVPASEATAAQDKIGRIADAIRNGIDMDALLASVNCDDELPVNRIEQPSFTADIHIGIARDRAFGFYYSDDLEKLERAGAILEFFDTLNDSRLPKVDGLFIGGGFPERHMLALENNRNLRAEVKTFIDAGKPVYTECGGLMYLCRQISWQGETHQMAGALPADVVMQEKPVGRGYVRLCETQKHPWPQAGLDHATEIPAHEFHYSRLENLPPNMDYAYRVTRGAGIAGGRDGLIYKNVLATYAHQRNIGANHWAERFVSHVRTHMKNETMKQSATG